MRVECSHCRELIEVAGLSAVPGGLGFTCTACGGVSLLAPVVAAPAPAAPAPAAPAPAAKPAPAPAPAAPALPAGYDACPKCGALHPVEGAGSDACARCGLVFAKVAAGTARLPAAPVVAAALRGRWEQLRADLDATDAHFAFIEACGAQNALEYAGHCYRGLTPPGHAEDPRVAVFRDRVLRQAAARVQMMVPNRDVSPAEAVQSNRKIIGALVLAFMIALFGVGYWYVTQMTNHALLPP